MDNSQSEEVQCPWCRHRFSVVTASTAMGFACPACGDECSLGALRNPDHRPEAFVIAEKTAAGSADNLFRHTVAYLFIDEDGRERNASGTVIQIGEKLFIATVKHAKPRSVEDIHLVKKKGLPVRGKNSFVIRRERSKLYDIAFLEVAAGALAHTGLEPITLDRIHDAATGDPNLKSRLIGYPDAFKLPHYPEAGMQGFCALCYGCETIEPSRWTAINHKFNPDEDVVIYFSSAVIEWDKSLPLPKGRPNPIGMSGGGLWQRREMIEDHQLWFPDDLCLIAIQAGWLLGDPFCFATQIIHWLRLVAEKNPELRPELRERFPRLETA